MGPSKRHGSTPGQTFVAASCRPRSALERQTQRLLVAGSCRPMRSPVRPLSRALRAFNTQWPWAPYGSGMKVAKPGHRRRSPRFDRGSESVAVDDVVPKINERASCLIPCPSIPLLGAEPGSATRWSALSPWSAGIYRQRAQSVDRPQPAWMLDFAPEIYRQLENRSDGKFSPGTQRNTFTVRLKGIPAIDLDRSRQTISF